MLTAELLRRCGTLIAVEVDPALCTTLRTRFAQDRRVSVVRGDFLRYELPRDRPYKAVGNIPYNSSAAVVRRLTDAPRAPEDAHLVMQREAAQRFAGGPFGPETLASLLLKPRWQIEIIRELRRDDFDPPPRVESVLIWLAHRTRPLVQQSEMAAYRRFVTACFGRTGRTVSRCLRPYLTGAQVKRLSGTLGFDPAAPPSALSFDQWLGLFRFHRRSGTRG